MNAILSRSCRAVVLGALLLSAGPAAASNHSHSAIVHESYGKSHMVLQIQGGS
jgi:hypothetical protein